MGYMGFGMRKIDYTRKPKKAFERIKEVYGEYGGALPKSPDSEHSYGVPSSFEKHRYQPFYKTRSFRIIKWLVISAIALLAVWFFGFRERYHEHQHQQFELSSFTGYYEQELKNHSEALYFLSSRTNLVCNANYRAHEGVYDLTLRDASLPPNTATDNISFVRYNALRTRQPRENYSEIENGNLIVYQDTKESLTISENWVYAMFGMKPNQIHPSVLDYLNSTQSEFLAFLKSLKQADTYIWVYPDSVVTQFEHPEFGLYNMVYSAQPLSSTTELEGKYVYQTFVGKLDERIYWVRKDRVLRSKIDE